MLCRGMQIWLVMALSAVALVEEAAASDLYTAQAITSGTAAPRRAIGLGLCLRDIVVKVTGDQTLLENDKLAARTSQVGDLIASFEFRDRMGGIPIHDEQGSYDRPHDLTCRFDRPKLDAFLASLGSRPWHLRPRVVLVVGIRGMNGAASTLASDGMGARDQDMRDALAAAADRLALPLTLPSQDELSKSGLDVANLSAASLAQLDRVVKAAGGDVALSGTMVWSDKALGWVGDWRIGSSGQDYRWRVSGVGFDDAFRNAVAGAAQVLSGHGQPADVTR